MAEMLVVKSKIKDVVGSDVNVAGDFAEAANEKLIVLINEAKTRCQANGRKTVSAKDL